MISTSNWKTVKNHLSVPSIPFHLTNGKLLAIIFKTTLPKDSSVVPLPLLHLPSSLSKEKPVTFIFASIIEALTPSPRKIVILSHLLMILSTASPAVPLSLSLTSRTPSMLRLQTIKAIVDSRNFKSPKSAEPRRVQVLDLYCLTRFESEGSSKEIVY